MKTYSFHFKNFLSKSTIQQKLLLIFFGFAIASSLSIGFVAYRASKQALEQRIGEGLYQQAAQIADQLDRMLFERYRVVQTLASDTVMLDILTEDVDGRIGHLLMTMKREYGIYADLVVVNAAGKVIASSNPSLIDQNVKQDPWFLETLSGQGIEVGDLTFSELLGKNTLPFSAPIRESLFEEVSDLGHSSLGAGRAHSNKILGIVTTFLDESVIDHLVNNPEIIHVESEKHSHAVLINRQGQMMTTPHLEGFSEISRKNLRQEGMKSATRAFRGERGFLVEKDPRGTPALVGFAPSRGYRDFKGLGWSLLVFERLTDAFAPIRQLHIQILSTVLLIVMVVILAAFFLARQITRPLKQLTRATQDIAKGDFSKRVHIQSGDEFEELGASFNKMTEDLTKAQEMMLQSEKMAAIGQLAGGVSHEINNPLGVILGFAQGLASRLKPGDSMEVPIKSIEREAKRCRDLVQDLLTFSRVGTLSKTAANVYETIEGALSLVVAQSKFSDVELTKDFQKDLPNIFVNQGQIQQVIINLSNNAIDAMPQGGKLILRAQKKVHENKEFVEISIKDTGEGILPENQAKIFEPFFTLKEVGQGTGLGLSLVYEIIQKHNGKIHVESEVGKGTTFYLMLPTKEE